MTTYDWIIVFIGAGIVLLFTLERTLRGLFGLAILWSATLASAISYREVAYRLQALLGPNEVLARGIMFDVLLLLVFFIGHIVVRISFPVTRLPKLGILDSLIGFVLGCIIAVIIMSLLVNSIGVMVIDRWDTDPDGWALLRYTYYNSGLRPYTSPVLAGYSWMFAIFFQYMPPVLIPQ